MMTLWIALALMGAAGTALADVQEIVVVVGAKEACGDATPERARWIADKASHDGDYNRAGECYLAAGQHSLADQAYVKAAFAQSKGDTSKLMASNVNDLKASARQLKQAFQHR